LVAGLLLAFQTVSLAQTTAGLRGVVVDKEGQPLPAATVTLTNTSLGVSQGARTDAKGEFRIAPLPPGKGYTLKVSFPAMSTIELDVDVTAGRMGVINVTLRPDAEMKETVKVVGSTDIVDTSKTSTETRYDAEFIDALPILGRNYQDVLTLAPGVTDVDGDGNINIHGSRDVDVVTLVDGVSTVDPYSGQVGQQLNLDSIEEIEIKTSGASAEFGRAQGGFVNIITKSGGNEFEGKAAFLFRSYIFDGDGAGIDDPRLHGGLGEQGLRDLSFNDFEPFVSLGGPFKKDKAWFFVTYEYRQIEEPVNALTQAFVRTEKQHRIFGKATWEISTNHKLQFTATLDPQKYFNQGIDSFTDLDAGFTLEFGGLNLTLKETSIFSPNLFLETTFQHFTSNPNVIPTLNADTNGNGILYIDRNEDGFIDGPERDPGQDLDRDYLNPAIGARWDVYEDRNDNGNLDPGEDRDGDGHLTPYFTDRLITSRGACEGETREDIDCDGFIDVINEDFNNNGRWDQGESSNSDQNWDNIDEDRNKDGVFDPRPVNEGGEDTNGNELWDGKGSYVEDRNGNFLLDDRPVVQIDDQIFKRLPDGTLVPESSLYPYGRLRPLQGDQDYTYDDRTGRTFGPYAQTLEAEVGRITLRQDLTLFVPEWHGQHEMKFGGVFEREHYVQDTFTRPFVLDNFGPPTQTSIDPKIAVQLPSANAVSNEARNVTVGMYVNDTYKPLPNLTFNVGVRFDREATDSFGYTPFDPVTQRENYDRMRQLAGDETTKTDKLLGNDDGIQSRGVICEPLFLGDGECRNNPSAGSLSLMLKTELLNLAPSRLTQHHLATSVTAAGLRDLFPDVIDEDGVIDREKLLELGSAFIQEREAFRLTNNNLAPRLAVSWDPWADSKTKVFATWGRFFDKLFLSAVTREEGPDAIYRYYRKDATGISANGIPNLGFGTPISKAPPSYTIVDRGLQTPFSDEWTIGFEREIAPEVSLRLSYINKKFREGLQDTDINHSLRFDSSGSPIDAIGTYPPSVDGAKVNRIPDGKPDLYLHNFFFNQVYFVGNINEGRYRGIELQLTKRLSRKWQMDASYTYSRALGDAEDFLSDLGDDPATTLYEFSRLDYDQRHVVKMNFATFLPRDWQVGATVEWSSGLPYSVVSFFSSLDNYDYLQQRRLFGFTPETLENTERKFEIIRRNTGQNNAFYLIDVRGEKALVLGRFNSKLFLTVENLLNTDVLDIDTYEPAAPNRAGRLQLDAERSFGRRFQAGIQFEF
jgi:outer membrane receptor protein involved in Fe transport